MSSGVDRQKIYQQLFWWSSAFSFLFPLLIVHWTFLDFQLVISKNKMFEDLGLWSSNLFYLFFFFFYNFLALYSPNNQDTHQCKNRLKNVFKNIKKRPSLSCKILIFLGFFEIFVILACLHRIIERDWRDLWYWTKKLTGLVTLIMLTNGQAKKVNQEHIVQGFSVTTHTK